ncbi:hypothetical protein [Bacillus solimangrovi]|uniref:Alpha-ribazole kinase n=1 Tax=Bacillus solimangrovi TaxID=1305675 RepID=A0A1E5LHG1_9BACI|nr:hypothetical protein [Bacillus solimangrovi]OEH93512.1 hypothetical protein BFG57_00525 [Bacillus solimangrovi]
MRDLQFVSINDNEEIVISADCSGGIGERQSDIVCASAEKTSYYTMRVALMELLSVGATLTSVTIHNLTGDDTWNAYQSGIQKALTELNLTDVSIGGSTESNFKLEQSALGITLTGIVKKNKKKIRKTKEDDLFAVIGTPLVGEQVLFREVEVAPLSLFLEIVNLGFVHEVVPIGSKGIRYEVEQLCVNNSLHVEQFESSINLNSSAGPATCFLVTYDERKHEMLKKLATPYFHTLLRKP